MKTFVTHYNRQLNSHSTFIHKGERYEFNYLLSDTEALVTGPHDSVAARHGDFGLVFHHLPEYFIMNVRTGTAAEEGQHLPNGELIVSVNPSGSRVNTSRTVYRPGHISQLWFVPRMQFNQSPPAMPEYKRGVEFDPPRETGHLLVDGEWRPYREVLPYEDSYFWTGSHCILDGVLVAFTDTVLMPNGGRIHSRDAVETTGGVWHRDQCIQINEVWHRLYNLRRVVDRDGEILRYLAPEDSADGLIPCSGPSRTSFALREDVRAVENGGYHPLNLCEDWAGDWYAGSWIRENTFVCDCCGSRFHNDEYGHDGRCEVCSEEEEDYDDYGRDSRIRDCSSRSANNLTPEENTPLKFGIEFEVESRSGKRSALLDHFDSVLPRRYAIYKSDGSLSDERGVEIVTRPDSPAVHKRIWAAALTDSARSLLNISSSCGIHIHVSRAPLTPLRIGRMLVFINQPCNKDLIRKVAGRYNHTYCGIKPDAKLTSARRGYGASRYDGLNITGRNTIEFRLFASSPASDPAVFLKNIEFVEAVLAFTDIATSGNRLLDTHTFMEFITKRRKDYPNLVKFMSVQ